jgi:diketogulonate reductase-like aldo/keto reductase
LLNVEFVDLLLLHHPILPYAFMNHRARLQSTWRQMEKLVDAGKAKALGVCNAGEAVMATLTEVARIPPMVNQVEAHPYAFPRALVGSCQNAGVRVMAFAPLGSSYLGRGASPLNDDAILRIAKSHGKSAAQVIIRWLMQNQVIPVVATRNVARVEENLDVFDFELAQGELSEISGLDRQERVWTDPTISAGYGVEPRNGRLVLPASMGRSRRAYVVSRIRHVLRATRGFIECKLYR